MASDDTPSLEDLAADLSAETPDVKEETVVAEPTETESSTDETTEDAETDTEETAEEPDDGESDETEPEPQQTPAENRKQQLNSEIRDLVTQKRDLIAEVERLNNQTYAPQSPDEIMAETGQSAVEARLTAMEQQRELDRYNTQVAEAQLVIENDSQRVLRELPMFNPESPEYRPEVANQAAQLVQQSIQTDPNTGQIIGSNIPIYQLYKTIANANQAAAVESQIKGQRSAEQMLAAAEPQSSAVPKQPKADPFLEGLTKGLTGLGN
jgi:hypothetical protein